MTDHIPIKDIKLASILSALGIPYRATDPVTCVVTTEGGKRNEQFTFWFDGSNGNQAKAKELIVAYRAAFDWSEYKLPIDHPLYYMKAALENREVFLNWIRKDVAPQKMIVSGDKTILVGERASQSTRDKLKGLLR